MRDKKLGFIIFIILIGAFIGSVLGEILGLIMPEGVVKQFFLRSVSPGFSPTTLNVLIFTFTVGFSLKINVISIIGIIISTYILKWYR